MTDIMKPKVHFDADSGVTSITGPSMEQIKQRLIEQFIQDQEGRTKQALIELGWSPPLAEHEKTAATFEGTPIDELTRPQLVKLVVEILDTYVR